MPAKMVAKLRVIAGSPTHHVLFRIEVGQTVLWSIGLRRGVSKSWAFRVLLAVLAALVAYATLRATALHTAVFPLP